MRGGVVVLVAAAVAVSGCVGAAGGRSAWDRPEGSPVWVDGEWWGWDAEVTSTQSLDGKSETREESVSTRAQVVRADVPTKKGFLSLVYSKPSAAAKGWLYATNPGNFSTYFLDAWTTPTCETADLCIPPLAATLNGDGEGAIQFPLAVGAAWSEDHSGEGGWSKSHAQVVSQETLTTPAGTFMAFRIHIEGTSGYGGESYRGNSTASQDVWYAPQVGHYIRAEGTFTFTMAQDVGGKDTLTQSFSATFRSVLSGHGVEDPLPIDELVALLDLPDAPKVPHIEGDFEVTIGNHPERFDVGRSWRFHAAVAGRDASALEARWTLSRDIPGQHPRLEAVGEGEVFEATFDAVGAFTLQVELVDGEGRMHARDSTDVYVDAHLEDVGDCRAAVAPVLLESDDTCEGFLFTLPPGFYALRGTARFAADEALLPCPALVLYKEGKEQTRNYWWSAQLHLSPAEVETAALEQEGTEWELRWQPSASRGGSVHYTVDIEAMGAGSYSGAGGNGC